MPGPWSCWRRRRGSPRPAAADVYKRQVLTNRLKTQTGNRLVKTGRKLTKIEKERYGKSAMIRYVAGSDEPIYPIGYIQHRHTKGYQEY